MSANSPIEWTDMTWNPVRGCSKVSRGCDHCYAIREAHRFSKAGQPYAGLTKTDPLNWTGVALEIPRLLYAPLKIRQPKRIFVNSMSDLFHEHVSVDFIAEVFATMSFAGRHTFQILTKRADRMRVVLTSKTFETAFNGEVARRWNLELAMGSTTESPRLPLANVWLGVSAEDQETADARIFELWETPAAVRFVSLEPLLSPVDLFYWSQKTVLQPYQAMGSRFGEVLTKYRQKTMLDWVIVGGESGPHARPMHPAWVTAIRDQCLHRNIPFFFKQWGEWTVHDSSPIDAEIRPYGNCDEIVIDEVGRDLSGCPGLWDGRETVLYRVGKKRAGRSLGGREWNEMPKSAATQEVKS